MMWGWAGPQRRGTTWSSVVLEVRVLGPLEVAAAGGAVDPGGPKERTVLALLALAVGPVSQDRLIDEVWEGPPPDTARKTLQTYVWRLRSALPAGAIGTVGGGYALRLETETDLVRFERLVNAGADALGDGDPGGARRAFVDALDLWRGEPFGGCAPAGALQACTVRLDELHGRAIEGRIEAELSLGRHAELVGELEEQVRATPFRERSWEMLVLALYRCGRQADALGAYRRARHVLVEELGVEPGPALQELQQAILEQRPELVGSAVAPTGGPPLRSERSRRTGRIPGGGAPPSGTVTFLFTGMEGAARLAEERPGQLRAALERYGEIVRSEIDTRGGFVFSTAGDSFGVAFSRAGDAVEAAVGAQRRVLAEPWPPEMPVRVRMGVHTAEAHERDGNYVGPAVDRAARLMGAAVGGEVLVSEATRVVLADRIGDELVLQAIGEVEVRGVDEPMVLHRLTGEGLGLPAVGPGGQRRGNLPEPLSSFVGREMELAGLSEALDAGRLVTVVGAGGVGKTQLALRMARRLAEHVEGGVWLVELARITRGDQTPAAVSRVLGVTPSPGLSMTDTVVEWLRRRRAVLVLDNCEHVAAAAAALAERVLAEAPGIVVLATSREPLFAAGELVVPLPPLSLGDSTSVGEAFELFVTRAREADPGFDPGPSADTISALCARLDGLPLAIELAAARMRALSPQALLDRLDDRFRLLTGGRRLAVGRHQTLRAAIGWSYDLLGAEDRRVFDALCVFEGVFDLDDAIAVVTGDGLDEIDVIDHVSALVDRSLVEAVDGEFRYRILQTVKAFGRERLDVLGDADRVRGRHADRFAERAALGRRGCLSPAEGELYERTIIQAGDYHAAVLWALDAGRVDQAVAITTDLAAAGTVWLWTEPTGWLQDLLDAPDPPITPRWAELLGLAGFRVSNDLGDFGLLRELTARARAVDPGEPFALMFACHMAALRSPEVALALADQMSESARTRHESIITLVSGMYQTMLSLALGQPERARAAAANAADFAQTTGSAFARGLQAVMEGRIESAADPDRARRLFAEALRLSLTTRAPVVEVNARMDLAWALSDTDPAAAVAGIRDALGLITDLGQHAQSHRVGQYGAVLLAEHGHETDAATLVGKVGLTPLLPTETVRFADAERAIARATGTGRHDLNERGAHMTILEIVDLAYHQLSDLAVTLGTQS